MGGRWLCQSDDWPVHSVLDHCVDVAELDRLRDAEEQRPIPFLQGEGLNVVDHRVRVHDTADELHGRDVLLTAGRPHVSLQLDSAVLSNGRAGAGQQADGGKEALQWSPPDECCQ